MKVNVHSYLQKVISVIKTVLINCDATWKYGMYQKTTARINHYCSDNEVLYLNLT